jgi:tocopherol cyclase
MDGQDGKYAFIQVITSEKSWSIPFPFSEFSASGGKFAVKIGPNMFSENGVSIDMNDNGLIIKGRIGYGRFTPIRYDIMGPFSILPFLECHHAIYSLHHTLNGSLQVNNTLLDFTGGQGYIEQDWGVSFPKKYIWMQTNDFPDENLPGLPDKLKAPGKGCLFLSIADIPFLGRNFQGCICILYIFGKEYRFATYLGVKIIQANKKSVILLQGSYTLVIDIEDDRAHSLKAPLRGEMTRIIWESEACRVHIRFFKKSALLLDHVSENTSFEFVE